MQSEASAFPLCSFHVFYQRVEIPVFFVSLLKRYRVKNHIVNITYGEIIGETHR